MRCTIKVSKTRKPINKNASIDRINQEFQSNEVYGTCQSPSIIFSCTDSSTVAISSFENFGISKTSEREGGDLGLGDIFLELLFGMGRLFFCTK